MSGSGGFYKYRCKYFYTHNCPNWVYCNGHACAMCLAEGREAADEPAASQGSTTWQQQHQQQLQLQQQQQQNPHQHHQQQQQQQQQQRHFTFSTEICVPQAIQGTLRYTVMEIVPTDEPGPGAYWVLRLKAMEPRPIPYSTMTTSDTPRPVMAPTTIAMPVQLGY